jgi:hypothetical protein
MRAAPVGLLGEGAVVGFASALFGVPEPFTVVPDEPVEVMSVSLADRPVALWPREVVKALHEQMKAQADWHCQRTQSMAAATAASQEKFAETGEGPPAWSVNVSPFLRHKQLSSWQAGTMKDRFEAEGWLWKLPSTDSPTVSGGSAAVSQRDSRSSSCPTLPALAGPKSPQAEGGRKAGVATPWGEWSPSGQLPPPRPKGDDPAARAARAQLRRLEAEKRRKPQQSLQEPVYRKEPQRHTLNLKCESDLRSLNANASQAALGKMYKQQVRKTAFG